MNDIVFIATLSVNPWLHARFRNINQNWEQGWIEIGLANVLDDSTFHAQVLSRCASTWCRAKHIYYTFLGVCRATVVLVVLSTRSSNLKRLDVVSFFYTCRDT